MSVRALLSEGVNEMFCTFLETKMQVLHKRVDYVREHLWHQSVLVAAKLISEH